MYFFNDTATTEIYTLSLPDALPIWGLAVRAAPNRPPSPRSLTTSSSRRPSSSSTSSPSRVKLVAYREGRRRSVTTRSWRGSEEHTSELQSRQYLVCRLLLENQIVGA